MWAVYYADAHSLHVPGRARACPTPSRILSALCYKAIARCKLRQDKRTRARQQARNIEKGDREREKKANAKEALERVDYPIYLYVLSYAYMSESITVRLRGMGTGQMGTILRFASVPLRKMGTDLLGSWWP